MLRQLIWIGFGEVGFYGTEAVDISIESCGLVKMDNELLPKKLQTRRKSG